MQLKFKVRNFLLKGIEQLCSFYSVDFDTSLVNFVVKVEYPPTNFGHYSSPCSLDLAKIFRCSPQKISAKLVEISKKLLNDTEYSWVEKVSIGGPGFVNIYVGFTLFNNLYTEGYLPQDGLLKIAQTAKYSNRKLLLEFVSSNPTGPLNIVSARSATIGDCLANVLKAVGIQVCKEFYVNNVGRQVRLLGYSVACRYLESKGVSFVLPDDCYQGSYVIDIMNTLLTENKLSPLLEVTKKRSFEDKLVKEWLLQIDFTFGTLACDLLLSQQKMTLLRYGVEFDSFFKESLLHEENALNKVFVRLEKTGTLYQNEDATFFRSTDFGDEKDRVIIRSDGNPTYLLADIAYHQNKVERDFHELINLWGPDHHGYIARLKGAMHVLHPAIESLLKVLIVQQVNLISSGKKLKMSKRLGSFSTMNDLLDEVSSECCRYFFISRSQSSHLDFDLSLATEESEKNPVYYIQYAHTRICSIFRELEIDYNKPFVCQYTDFCDKSIFLESPERLELFTFLMRFCDEIEYITETYEVHRLATYTLKLSQLFTKFYHAKSNRLKVLFKENFSHFDALLYLTYLSGKTLKLALELLGIPAKEQM